MPHNWIQDPRSIPPEVVAALQKDLDSIPDELWAYSERAYPERVPKELKASLRLVQESWRRDFISERRAMYLERAQLDSTAAEADWFQEQREFPWLYGTAPIALFTDGGLLGDRQPVQEEPKL